MNIALLLLCALASTAETPTIEGVWIVEDGKAHVRIESCGVDLCGTIVWLGEPLDENGRPRSDVNNADPRLRDRPILGLRILEGVPRAPNEEGRWSGGRIYDPEAGKSYRCTMRLDTNGRLVIRGFIGLRLFGRTTSWRRVDGALQADGSDGCIRSPPSP